MSKYLLECCVDSVESAIAAHKGGADRLELCSNLLIGGTTPGIKLYEMVKQQCDLPIRILIRPRYGDFLYTEYEYAMMQEEVMMFSEAGAEGMVIGCLLEDGTFDMKRMERFKDLTSSGKLTVHRAFDMTSNPLRAFEELTQLGVDTILTSGQARSCIQGAKLIENLLELAEDKVNLLLGGGIDALAVKQFLQSTKAKHFHMSGKKQFHGGMKYEKEDVSMGLPLLSEYMLIRTDEEAVRQVKIILEERERALCYYPEN